MRKFICTADIHIIIKKDIPEEWQTKRYLQLFRTLVADCKEQNAQLIIAGDLFEKAAPSLQELQLMYVFFDMLQKENIQTYLIAGNHCTLGEELSTFHYLRESFPERVLCMPAMHIMLKEDTIIHFKNHCDLKRVDDLSEYEADYPGYTHLLVTHVRATVGEYIKEEVDIRKLCDPYKLVIAGDIHSDYEDGNLVYTDQPINSQFATNPTGGYILLTIEKGKDPVWERVPLFLPRLLQVTCDIVDLPTVLAGTTKVDFYRLVVTGNQKELRGVRIAQPNISLQRVPLLDTAIPEDIEEMQRVDLLPLDAQLVEYLRLLNYAEDKVESLLSIWKES